ncbi:hypothetical protein TrVE_jg9418 [Triparma verrucosa]|uniref:YqaJ viral recombinase domain-containing protein n=1 Tax=Triparma verrucosa TaxID=1606542 RepID=A0A9W7F606_9STRA|nr:hypothetical protein TrVE_jg9418 [Triparma verrucosa]
MRLVGLLVSLLLASLASICDTYGVPDVNWRALSESQLAELDNYDPLPEPETVKAVASRFDVRLFKQSSWQWRIMHEGRITTSKASAAAGLLEPAAALILGVPKTLCGHGKALGARAKLKGVGRLGEERFGELVGEREVEGLGLGGVVERAKGKKPYYPHIGSVRMAWGRSQESTAIAVAADYFSKLGGRVEEVGLCLTEGDDGLFGASPDGIVRDGNGNIWALEVKNHCPFAEGRGAKAKKLDRSERYIVRDRSAPESVMPWVIPQLMLESYAVGEECQGAVLVRLTATMGASILRVKRDDTYIQELLKWLRLFNTRYLGDEEPTCDFFADEPGHREFVEKTLELASGDNVEVVEYVNSKEVRRPGGRTDSLFL